MAVRQVTEADFERLTWHDNPVYGVRFEIGDPDRNDWRAQLILELDCIEEWSCGDDGAASFKFAPTRLTFHDVTDRLFRPDIDLEAIKPKPLPPRNQAFKGEMMRLLLSALRQSQGPLKTSELTRHVMAERGLNSADTRLMLTLSKRVGSALRYLRGRGLVMSEDGPGQLLVWEIAG